MKTPTETGQSEGDSLANFTITSLQEQLAAVTKERDELREALENTAAFIKPEVHFILFQKTQAALSTPPPPVVPREDAEKLAEALDKAARWAQLGLVDYLPEFAKALEAILIAYRAKHPLPQP